MTCQWLLVGALITAGAGFAAEGPPPVQDPAFLRYVERAVAYCPDSTFKMASARAKACACFSVASSTLPCSSPDGGCAASPARS